MSVSDDPILHVRQSEMPKPCARVHVGRSTLVYWSLIGGLLIYLITMHSFFIGNLDDLKRKFQERVSHELETRWETRQSAFRQTLLVEVQNQAQQVVEQRWRQIADQLNGLEVLESRLRQAESLLRQAQLWKWVVLTPDQERDAEVLRRVEALEQK